MTQKTVKWKLFPFSHTERAKQWFARTVGSLNGDWERLQDKFCLAFFPISHITSLQKEILGFQQYEKESIGAAWARFSDLVHSGPNLSLPNHVLLLHFYLGLDKESVLYLKRDLSVGH
jgi:hypothetical protein